MKGSVDCPGGVSCETKNSWLATARARIGYAGWSNWLPYITAGAAGGDIKATDVVGSATKTKIGWTAGLGVEYAFMSNWSAKLEYLYADLGKFDCGSSCMAWSGPPTTSASKPTSCARASTTASDYRASLSAQRRKAPDGSPGFFFWAWVPPLPSAPSVLRALTAARGECQRTVPRLVPHAVSAANGISGAKLWPLA